MFEGRVPEPKKADKVLNWPVPRNVTKVRGFLGLCGGVRIWIRGYSALARPLTELTRKEEPFIWTKQRQEAMDKLKSLVTTAQALQSINYKSDTEMILAVDTSNIAIGIELLQIDDQGKRRPARYGSIPINEREAKYSQSKLELFSLFKALRAFRLFIFGVKNLTVEVDAKYIKGMLNAPDLQLNATINRWIAGILLFNFTLKHVPAEQHKVPDALS